MQPNDLIRLRHMLDAAHEALRFVHGKQRIDLDSDRQLVWALVKAIEIIGEAAYQMAPTVRAEIPDLPWNGIIGMRHRLVHAYFDINLDILWKTVQQGLPPLVAGIEKYLSTVDTGSNR
jgi:uncharacterized protein with HEPN domain